MKFLQSKNAFIVNFEDRGPGRKFANMVFNPIFHGKTNRNEYFGHRYVCLREEFQFWTKKSIRKKAQKALITFGGTDPTNKTEFILKIIENSNLKLSTKEKTSTAVIIGNGNGGFPELEYNSRLQVTKGEMKISPYFIPMILPNMAAANISRTFGFQGFSSTVVTACAASTQSIGDAAQLINNGLCDVVLAGGCEAGISKLGLGGFSALRALSTNKDNPEKASRPFDSLRDGFVPSEGAGILILESESHALKRNANVFCEIAGMGVSSDAYHPVQPDPSGSGAILAMQRAMQSANINIDDIDYINAHGTSTPLNDACETNAIKKTFKDKAYKIPISSTKSMIGHALGGAGALEAIATILSIINQKAHPTINLENPDPECDLNYIPNKSQDIKIKHAMSNNFGFGGQNACLLYTSPSPRDRG